MRQTQRSPEGPRHLHRIPRLSEAPRDDFFGEKQSGVPVFKMANLIEDYKILEVAMQDAYRLVSSDEFHHNNEFLGLRDYIHETVANEMHQFD